MTWTVVTWLLGHRNMLACHTEAPFGTDWHRRESGVGDGNSPEGNPRLKRGHWNTTLSYSLVAC